MHIMMVKYYSFLKLLYFCRLAAIEENMKMMPKMIEEYRTKCREARQLMKEKKRDTEEQIYLKATGKIRQQHEWEKNRDKKKKKKFAKKK